MKICRGTTTSRVAMKSYVSLTMSRPSLEIVTALRHRLMSLPFVSSFEERVPWMRSAWVRLMSGHSNRMYFHAAHVVNESMAFPFNIPSMFIWRTTEFSVWLTNVHIWQFGASHYVALRLDLQSQKEHWLILPNVRHLFRNDWQLISKLKRFAEKTPRQRFSLACTHALLSVRMYGFNFDWIMYGPKYLVATAMESASISHDSHVIFRFRNFALMKPARWVFDSRVTYRVPPIAGFFVAPTVAIHNWSPDWGRMMSWFDDRRFVLFGKLAKVYLSTKSFLQSV